MQYIVTKPLFVLFFLALTSTICSSHAQPRCPQVFGKSSLPFQISELENEFQDGQTLLAQKETRIRFEGTQGRDVYNPTAPFKIHFFGREIKVIAARTESRDSETDTEIWFFTKTGPLSYAPLMIQGSPFVFNGENLQDPFFSQIGDETFIGGVRVEEDPSRNDGALRYRTVFFRGTSLEGMKEFAQGPWGMKDIRFAQFVDQTGQQKLFLLTRPQGTALNGGRGKLAYTVLSSIDELNSESILSARLIDDQIVESQWIGGNEIHLLANGKIGLLAHVARFDEDGNRHYYPVALTLDPSTGETTRPKLLAMRQYLEGGVDISRSKRAGLADVLFSGGLEIVSKNEVYLWLGAGDAETHRVRIHSPF